jgi:hypothetical protein
VAVVDIVNFPKLIIQIPQAQFPDNLKIVMRGRKTASGGDAHTLQLQSEARSSGGLPANDPFTFTTWTESNFTVSRGTNKVAEVAAPYDEILSVVGYAHRNDSSNDTEVDVTMFTARPNSQPSATSTTYNLDSVWAFKMALTKQVIDSNYIVGFVDDTTTVGQGGSLITQFASFFGQIVAALINPTLPTPKAIASKFLGPAAAPVQQLLATTADQYAKVKPVVDEVVVAADAVAKIAQNPAVLVQYLPVLMGFLIQFIGQDKLAQIIYEFKGGV